MTDRIKGFMVALDVDYRDDDVEIIKSAISQIRGVQWVSPILTKPDDWINRERIKRELQEKLWEILK